MHNVVVTQSDDKAVNLDADSIDVAICIDVYHHLLFPKTFSKSVHRALRPGGKYVVIDFHRDPAIFANGDPGNQLNTAFAACNRTIRGVDALCVAIAVTRILIRIY